MRRRRRRRRKSEKEEEEEEEEHGKKQKKKKNHRAKKSASVDALALALGAFFSLKGQEDIDEAAPEGSAHRSRGC